MASIFDKTRLDPHQLRTAANRRFDDAQCLCKTGRNPRANGAMYLGGFVVECLLKAQLLMKYPWLRNAGYPHSRPQSEQWIWSLCYRSHDLDEILGLLPHIADRVAAADPSGSLLQHLKNVCQLWTIFARYSPYSADITEATDFLTKIEELKKWLA